MSAGELTKTLTFGLGTVWAWGVKTKELIPLTDEQRKVVYNGLRDASIIVARVINLLNGREYLRRIMEVPDSLVDEFKPNYSLVKGPLRRLGITEIDQVAGSVLSQTFALGVKPDFQGEHGKSLVFKGERQISLHRTDGTHPISQRHQETILVNSFKGEKFYLVMQIFASEWSKSQGLPSGWIAFSVNVKPRDKVLARQLTKAMSGEWKLKNSRVMRNTRKRGNRWVGQVVVSYQPEPHKSLQEDVVMGVDLGVNVPACLHIREDSGPLPWAMMVGRGRDMIQARSQTRFEIVRIVRSLKSKDSPLAGGDRKKAVERLRDLRKQEKRIMKTACQKVAARLADVALRNGAGTWQVESLSSSIKDEEPWLARNWAPGMLMDAVRWQAKQVGANLVFVDPAYTSQRCAKCGHIASENRPKGKKGQAVFQCVVCGNKDNADKNAARNLSMVGIEDLIQKTLAPNGAARQVA